MRERFIAYKVFATGVFLLAAFIISPSARAQTAAPQFLITWRALKSYVPAAYPDKAVPSYGSPVVASVELLSQGKVLNIKSQTIYWYLNENFIGGGIGLQTVSFLPFDVPPNTLDLRVELPHYNGVLLTRQVQVQTLRPVAVVEAPFPNGQTSVNPTTVTALPYFFNTTAASNLSFSWSVNGQSGANAENPQTAQITLPAGTQSGAELDVMLTINNPSDSTAATAYSTLTYVKQL